KILAKIFFLILCVSTFKTFSQKYLLNNLLQPIWQLENEKFEDYSTFLIFSKNEIYRFELNGNKLHKPNSYYYATYFFLSDSTFDILSAKELKDQELADFFNEKKNKDLLLTNTTLDFSKEDKMVYLVYLLRENGKYGVAHLYSYQFYSTTTFNQYGYGWTPGQPQIGYIYNLANNIPKEVMLEVQKINPFRYKTLDVKQAKIFNDKRIATKMYLLKDDIVEVLEEKNDWLKIRYYGKKTVEGWIKKSDVGAN
ncbi:SH3 domain-containing protein, partial [Emticicia sp. 17c]|uniref:SH3 domain-containing protein n=1 Tax=Emticicia sp. 17c TaxID=3127704 RepID=UPI00301D298D